MVPFRAGFKQKWDTHLLHIYIGMAACCSFSFFLFSLWLSSSVYLLALLPFVRGKSKHNMSLISSMPPGQAFVVLMKTQAVQYDTLLTEAVRGLGPPGSVDPLNSLSTN